MAPKTILFDYGQTLVHEILWDPLAGAEALLDCARKNPRNVSPAQLSDLLESIKQDILRAFGVSTRSGQPLEIPAAAIYGYAFRRLGLEFDLTMEELEWRYWQAGAPAEPAEHILPLLEDLERQGITLGVVSNLMYTGRTLERRLEHFLPGQKFSFVLSTCDYVYRKPSKQIFDLALTLAGCKSEDALFCGDNLRCDIWGAHNAGIPSVWYTKYVKHRPELTIPETAVELTDWRNLPALWAPSVAL